MREIVIGAARMGPIQKADSRAAAVARKIALLERAHARGCAMAAHPERALTNSLPRGGMKDPAAVSAWFERTMPNAATQPLFGRACAPGVAIGFGHAALTPEDRRVNTPGVNSQNAALAMAVAKAGAEDGHPLIAGSTTANPYGVVAARAERERDERLPHACDMDACAFGQRTIFDIARHRRIERHGPVTARTGVNPPA